MGLRRYLAALMIAMLGAWAVPSANLASAADAPPALAERTVKPLGKMEGIIWGDPLVSPNGERMAWVVKRDDKLVVVCDGKEGTEYMGSSAYVARLRMRFSQDGKRLVYLATKPPGTYVWVCDRVEITGHPSYQFTFSPDGRHTAYWGASGETIRDGRPAGSAIAGKTYVFSPDSRHLAYAASLCIVCDGKKGPEFEKGAVLGDPVWTPDSQSCAHTVSQGDKIGDKWVVFWADKKIGGPYDMVEGIAFSPDSKRIAYRALAKDKWTVVVNDKKCEAFNSVRTIVFSPDGKRMAYAACDDEGWRIVCDGKKGPAFSEVGDPVFSADSKHMTYRVLKDGEARVICDGKETPPIGAVIWVGFSPDSKHLAFAAERGKDKFIVCDGLEGPAHERMIVPERPADKEGKLRTVVIDKAEASLVEVDWPADRTWEDAFKGSTP